MKSFYTKMARWWWWTDSGHREMKAVGFPGISAWNSPWVCSGWVCVGMFSVVWLRLQVGCLGSVCPSLSMRALVSPPCLYKSPFLPAGQSSDWSCQYLRAFCLRVQYVIQLGMLNKFRSRVNESEKWKYWGLSTQGMGLSLQHKGFELVVI